jgi:uncharacterized protein YggE
MHGSIESSKQNMAKNTIAAVKIAVLPFLLCLWTFTIPAAIAQEVRPSRTLVVTGQGDRPVQTTKAGIQIGIEVEAKTAQEVQVEIARKTNALVSKLQELNVEKLQTTNITLNPKYVYENNRQRQTGFTGQTSVSFVTSLDKAGTTLDAAVEVGANRVDRISFIAPEEAIRTARNAALQDAVKDAQAQADVVLSALNLKVQSVRTIQVNNASPSQPVFANRAQFSTADAAPPTPVIGGEQRVQTSVTVEFSY